LPQPEHANKPPRVKPISISSRFFSAIDQCRVLHVADAKDAKTVAAFAADLEAHDGKAGNIAEVCIDMSATFIKGVGDHLPVCAFSTAKRYRVRP
jgi:hypothetical protein